MQIVCPSCTARYEIDAAKLGPAGRKVRCASCQTLWQVDPPEVDVPEAPAAETAATDDLPPPPSAEETTSLLEEEFRRAVASEAADEPPATANDQAPDVATSVEPALPAAHATRRKRPARKPSARATQLAARARALRLPLAIGCAGLAVLGLVTWQREAAVRAAPQLAGLFAAAGLPVNVLGLRLTAVESTLTDAEKGRFLVVEGDVTNIARGVRAVPPIEVAVRDEAGQALYTWTTDPPRPQLEPSELVRFRARLATPPEAGRSVTVRFASDSR